MTTQDKPVVAHGGVLETLPATAATVETDRALAGTGGDGQVTATHDGGGHILQHARIVLIYWGTAWTDPTTTPPQSDFTNALADILSGPWGTQMAQYRGIGPLSLDQIDVNNVSDPPTSFTNPEIQNMIDGRITNGNVPTPSSTVDRIYCVLMPTGHSSGDTPFVGQHQYYDRNGVRVYWAWVTNDGTLTGGNSIPKVFTHEVAEACTDPDLGSGITVTSVNEGDEIGDVCNNTYSPINGAAEEAYWSAADNRCVLPRLQPFPSLAGNPVLIQGPFGSQGNFELLVPAASDGLSHFWRNNDNPYMPWSGPTSFGQFLGAIDAVTMIASNYGGPGTLQVVARVGNQLVYSWRDSGPAFHWNGPFAIEVGIAVAGNPVLIQSSLSSQGNFELLVPAAGGGLIYFWHNNADSNLPWSGPTSFGQILGVVDAVTMIESNYGSPGTLEVIARVGNQLQYFWRDSGPAFHWNGPFAIEVGIAVAGNPVLIQSRLGSQGNFELLVPAAGGGLIHFWHDNADSNLPWSGPTYFGQSLGVVDAVTMIESNYGNPGNLEVVARVGNQLQYFWRDSGPAFHWNGPFLLQSTVW